MAGVALLLIAAFVVVIVMFSYGKLWLQAVMSNAHVSLFTLVGMSLRQVHARTIVEAKIMAMQAGVGHRSAYGHHHAAARSALPGRRQRAAGDPRADRRASGRHRSRFRPGGGDRPGRARRARRGAHERLSESDRLPGSGEVGPHDAERGGEERRRAVGSGAGDGADEPRRS